MFTVAEASAGAALHVRLSGCVTTADLNAHARAWQCERCIERLQPGQHILVEFAGVRQIDAEAQGVLLFLFQRALQKSDTRIIFSAPSTLLHALRQGVLRRFMAHPRVCLVGRLGQAMERVRQV